VERNASTTWWHRLSPWEVELPGARVEGGEQPVLDQDIRPAQPVQQRRLPGIGVTDQGHRPLAGPDPPAALGAPGAVQLTQIGLETAHPLHQAAPVDLEFRLAGTTGADAAGLLAERPAPSPQSRQPVAEKRQLHLGPTLGGAGVLGEDVEDHRGAVDGGTPQDLLEVPLLGR
jgi:hypothetical protein